MDRARFIQEMKNRNIGTSVHFIPLHMHPYYRKMYGYKPEDFSGAKYLYETIVSLPIYPKMKKEDVEDVIWSVKDIVAKYRKFVERNFTWRKVFDRMDKIWEKISENRLNTA